MPGGTGRRLVLLNRDLRLHDHPTLRAAGAGGVVAFVLDEELLALPTLGANRLAYLLEALEALREACRGLGGDLVVRRGRLREEVPALAEAVGASELHVTRDVSAFARRRERLLGELCSGSGRTLVLHDGVGIVSPGSLAPAGGDHYKVFTPYWRTWQVSARRRLLPPPRTMAPLPTGLEPGRIPSLAELAGGGRRADPLGRRVARALVAGDASPLRQAGGERAARQRLAAFAGRAAAYEADRDDLSRDGTSRLSADLHFGCLSALEVEARVGDRSPEYIRQLCWRDFFLSVTHADPDVARRDYRPRPWRWRRDDDELEAWRRGETGVPLVDAAMHQLEAEGYVHGRARLVAASYLTKTLRHHWREGADHFLRTLTDGDVASNSCNWQWMAGTGNDTRPNRVLNPERQAKRFDPSGRYRARYGTGTGVP